MHICLIHQSFASTLTDLTPTQPSPTLTALQVHRPPSAARGLPGGPVLRAGGEEEGGPAPLPGGEGGALPQGEASGGGGGDGDGDGDWVGLEFGMNSVV